ncbi:MAG: RtcB family protein [Brevinematales bacterium]
MQLNSLHRVSDYEWMIPRQDAMLVDGVIIGSRLIVEAMDEAVYSQLKKVASLPGILEKAIVLPNAHAGTGFPVGCVAAFDLKEGVIFIEGALYDYNCGERLVTTNLIYQDIEKKVDTLIKAFFKIIPTGAMTQGKISLSRKELRDMMSEGAKWVITNRGMGKEDELEYIEDNGFAPGADPDFVSEEAIKKEKNNLGTLGGSNHYLELQVVDEVFDIEKARVFGLFKNQVVVTFHAGSRGLGHQIGLDYQSLFRSMNPEAVHLLSESEEGKRYMGAVRAASNYAFANRQVISHAVHNVFNDIIKDVDTNTMYDLGHNTIKEEVHKIGSSKRPVLVHRRGATRSFSGKMQEISRPYRVSGQPVIVGGSMGTYSYVLSGREESIERTFASTVHGTGRAMTPEDAKKLSDFEVINEDLLKKNIFLKTKNKELALEEAPYAYKDIEEIVQSISKSGLSQRVARLKPIGVIKS